MPKGKTTGLKKFEKEIQELLVICMLQMLVTIITVVRDLLVIIIINRKVAVTISRNTDSNSDEAVTDVVKSLLWL